MISPQFRPLIGGYERAAERLASELAGRGHHVTVVAERRSGKWPRRERIGGFTLQRLWCCYHPRLHMVSSLCFFASFLLIRGMHYDLFHIHQYGAHCSLAILVGKIMRRPVVLKITSTKEQSIENSLNRSSLVWKYIVSRLYRKADAYLAPSRRAFAEVSSFEFNSGRIHLAHNGLQTEAFFPCTTDVKQGIRSSLGLRCRFMALFCGRLAEPKNPDGLLRVWPEVTREVPGSLLCVVGDGPLRSSMMEQIINQKLENSVMLVRAQSDVLPWYHAADLFILPSHLEGLSNSLLEALSCGLPIVSTAVSGSTDVFRLGDVGELVPVRNLQALRDAVIRILKDSRRMRRCGMDARRVAVRHFSISLAADQVIELYRTLCPGH